MLLERTLIMTTLLLTICYHHLSFNSSDTIKIRIRYLYEMVNGYFISITKHLERRFNNRTETFCRIVLGILLISFPKTVFNRL